VFVFAAVHLCVSKVAAYIRTMWYHLHVDTRVNR